MKCVIKKLCDKLGLPFNLFFGYIGLIFFMLGASIESSWFSSYLVSNGYEIRMASLVFTLYGLSVAFFSWITSFLVAKYSIRKVMSWGIWIYLISTILLLISLETSLVLGTIVSYMLRGASYPLFAYSFLIWITLTTNKKELGKATSWFWFSFNMGMTIISPTLASFLLNYLDPNMILILGILFVLIGGTLSLKVNRTKTDNKLSSNSLIAEMKNGILVMKDYPILFIGMVVKAINNIGQFGFVIMMPIFLIDKGFTLFEWGTIWSTTYIVNSFAGLFFGFLGDKYGWQKIVVYFSGTLTGISCLLIAFVTYKYPGNYLLLLLAFIVYAFGIAAFGPLSALIPSLVPEKKIEAISVLNLGSGLSNFVGPILITFLFQSFGGEFVLIVFALLYFLGSVLSIKLKVPQEST